jgi:hypothetical protein
LPRSLEISRNAMTRTGLLVLAILLNGTLPGAKQGPAQLFTDLKTPMRMQPQLSKSTVKDRKRWIRSHPSSTLTLFPFVSLLMMVVNFQATAGTNAKCAARKIAPAAYHFAEPDTAGTWRW